MRLRALVFIVVCLCGVSARTASAQTAIEVGSSLTSVMFHSDKYSDSTTLGVPSATLGLVDPSVYASFFLGPNEAVEPRFGFIWQSSGGHTYSVVTVGAQFDYFTAGTANQSPFLFAGAGVSDASGPNANPVYVVVGGGMRFLAGDRLAFRLDGHYTHYTDNNGNAFTIGFSIGGVFHHR